MDERESLFDQIQPPNVGDAEAARKSTSSKSMTLKEAKVKLLTLVPTALDALERAMGCDEDDWPTVVKAATAVLDRAGMGAKSTITIEEGEADLTTKSDEELAQMADAIAEQLRSTHSTVH